MPKEQTSSSLPKAKKARTEQENINNHDIVNVDDDDDDEVIVVPPPLPPPLQGTKDEEGKDDNKESRNENPNDELVPPAWMNQLVVQPRPTSHSSSTSNDEKRQPLVMLLLMGVPGSGKSTLADLLCRVQPWRFVRVNQDELKSRPRCISVAQRALLAHQVPIIDRCHVSSEQRSYFIDLARKLQGQLQRRVVVDIVVLQAATAATCLRRCQTRDYHPTLDGHTAARVIRNMQADWEEPHTSEGFRTVTIVGDGHHTLQSVVDDLLHVE